MPFLFSELSAIEQFKRSKEPKKWYEILSFASTEGYTLCVLSRNENGTFGGFDAQEHSLLSSSLHKILSVKRLSDGEIFTVGDKIKGWGETPIIEIKKFEIDYFDNTRITAYHYNGYGVGINSWEKIKQTLFTTEDGVEITDEKQTLYAVLTKAQWQTKEDTVKRMRERSQFSKPLNNSWKYFSTNEARTDYILMNEPILSVNDVFKQDILNTFDGITILKKDVIELAKSKLTNG
jgi:hypothetical protein